MRVPASVRVVCEGEFCRCRALKIVEFEVGSRLERLGEGCFERSWVVELVFPAGTRDLGCGAFCGCARGRFLAVRA